jgi:hypothetical protein
MHRTSHADFVGQREQGADTSRAHDMLSRSVQHANLIATPGAGTHLAGYVIHPGVDFLHRLVALFFSVLIVFGTYSIFDRSFGRMIMTHASQGVSEIRTVASVALGGEPNCSSSSERLVASAVHVSESVFYSINALFPTNTQIARVTDMPPCAK